MKKIYEAPELKIVSVSAEDVFTTSGGFDGEDDELI